MTWQHDLLSAGKFPAGKTPVFRVEGHGLGARLAGKALVCYLSAGTSTDVPAGVRAAAAKIPADAPAWATLTYLELSLRMRERAAAATPMSREDSQALRTRFDAALAKGDAVFGGDGINAIRVLRARVSASTLALATASRLDPGRYPWHDDIGRAIPNEVQDSAIGVTLLSTSVDVRQPVPPAPRLAPMAGRRACPARARRLSRRLPSRPCTGCSRSRRSEADEILLLAPWRATKAGDGRSTREGA